jgi:hypothetical protein
MKYNKLVVRSYARSASNFIEHNTIAINNEIPVEKSYWGDIDKKNNNEVIISVLRDPKEAIISDLSMSLGNQDLNKDCYPEIDFGWSINNFKEYLNLLNDNINNILPFTFDQITTDSKTNFKIFLSECGYLEDFIFPNVKINKKIVINTNNNKRQFFFPTSKNLNIYDHIAKSKNIEILFKPIQNDYKDTLANIYKRQLDFK